MLLLLFLITTFSQSIATFEVGSGSGDEVSADVCRLPNGNFPNPDKCASFVTCQSAEPEVEQCPDGLLFNPFIMTCDFSVTGACSNLEDFNSSSAPFPTNDIDCSTYNTTVTNIYLIQSSCSEYYLCDYETAFLVKCPSGLLMNGKKLTCDYEENVECETPTLESTLFQSTVNQFNVPTLSTENIRTSSELTVAKYVPTEQMSLKQNETSWSLISDFTVYQKSTDLPVSTGQIKDEEIETTSKATTIKSLTTESTLGPVTSTSGYIITINDEATPSDITNPYTDLTNQIDYFTKTNVAGQSEGLIDSVAIAKSVYATSEENITTAKTETSSDIAALTDFFSIFTEPTLAENPKDTKIIEEFIIGYPTTKRGKKGTDSKGTNKINTLELTSTKKTPTKLAEQTSPVSKTEPLEIQQATFTPPFSASILVNVTDMTSQQLLSTSLSLEGLLTEINDVDQTLVKNATKNEDIFAPKLSSGEFSDFSGSGDLYDETMHYSIRSSTPATKSSTGSKPQEFACPRREGLFKYPGNCGKFYQCSNWYPYEMRCAASTHFSEISKRCEWPCDAKCDSSLSCGESLKHSTVAPRDPQCSCLNCKLPSPETCSKYIVCTKGRARIEYCPRGQTFEMKRSHCDWAHKVKCSHSEMCPELNGLFLSKDDCHKFVHCSNGIPYVKKCPYVLEFDPVSKRCEWPNGRCSISPVRKEFDMLKAEEHNEGWECPKTFGYFSDDVHCNRFYRCSQGTPALKECSEGLLYNPRLQTCDWKDHVRCNSKRHRTAKRCRVYDRNLKCPSDRTPQPHTLCSMYYDCTDGRACAKQCPLGLYFNTKTGMCDLPANVECFFAGGEEYSLKKFSSSCQSSGHHKRIVNPTDDSCFYYCRRGKVVSDCCSRSHVYNEHQDKCERRTKSFRL